MTFKDPAPGGLDAGAAEAPVELTDEERSSSAACEDVERASAARARFLEALASPARLEVVEGLQVVGPSSVAELARRLGRAADALYYHLRELERAGVVEVCGRTPAPRGHGGRRGAIYRIAAEVVGGDVAPSDDAHESAGDSKRERAALGAMASAILRLTERNVGLSLTGPAPRRPGPGGGSAV